ncbi:MAG: hypothetical protein SFU98_21515 [Leptospiraceae bacterium]|nr:hypothetical protein [Leptospiraceae bacterium]
MNEIEFYRKERNLYKQLSQFLTYTANLSLVAFIGVIVYYAGKLPPIEYSILTYFAIFNRVMNLLNFKAFEVPNIFYKILEGDSNSRKILEENRVEILDPMFKSFYGIGYDRRELEKNLDDILVLVQARLEINWKMIGKIFLFIYPILSLLTIWVIL